MVSEPHLSTMLNNCEFAATENAEVVVILRVLRKKFLNWTMKISKYFLKPFLTESGVDKLMRAACITSF